MKTDICTCTHKKHEHVNFGDKGESGRRNTMCDYYICDCQQFILDKNPGQHLAHCPRCLHLCDLITGIHTPDEFCVCCETKRDKEDIQYRLEQNRKLLA